MGKISWTDRVENEEVLHRVNKDRNIIQTVKRRNVRWIGHILRRNCLLKHATEGKIEGRICVTERRGRRGKQLLVDLKEKWRNWNLKGETLRIRCRTCFGGGCETVAVQTRNWSHFCKSLGYKDSKTGISLPLHASDFHWPYSESLVAVL